MPTATCQCGALTATVAAYSPAVVACHCRACQRRTGSAFGVAGYYPAEAVTITGQARTFARPTATGGLFIQSFCADCGATVYWSTAKHPGLIGIAAGAFADPAHPAPLRSVLEESRQAWVALDAVPAHYPRGVP